jgi:hypothetical protein
MKDDIYSNLLPAGFLLGQKGQNNFHARWSLYFEGHPPRLLSTDPIRILKSLFIIRQWMEDPSYIGIGTREKWSHIEWVVSQPREVNCLKWAIRDLHLPPVCRLRFKFNRKFCACHNAQWVELFWLEKKSSPLQKHFPKLDRVAFEFDKAADLPNIDDLLDEDASLLDPLLSFVYSAAPIRLTFDGLDIPIDTRPAPATRSVCRQTHMQEVCRPGPRSDPRHNIRQKILDRIERLESSFEETTAGAFEKYNQTSLPISFLYAQFLIKERSRKRDDR